MSTVIFHLMTNCELSVLLVKLEIHFVCWVCVIWKIRDSSGRKTIELKLFAWFNLIHLKSPRMKAAGDFLDLHNFLWKLFQLFMIRFIGLWGFDCVIRNAPHALKPTRVGLLESLEAETINQSEPMIYPCSRQLIPDKCNVSERSNQICYELKRDRLHSSQVI